jgi:hypothetical protein
MPARIAWRLLHQVPRVDSETMLTEQGTHQKLEKLREYQELVKQVMAVADKDTIEEVARVLAAHIGSYQRRYGKIGLEETLASLHAQRPSDEQIADLAEGMQTLVAVFMLATGVADDMGGQA